MPPVWSVHLINGLLSKTRSQVYALDIMMSKMRNRSWCNDVDTVGRPLMVQYNVISLCATNALL